VQRNSRAVEERSSTSKSRKLEFEVEQRREGGRFGSLVRSLSSLGCLMPPLYDSQYPSTTDFNDTSDPMSVLLSLPSLERFQLEEAVEEAGRSTTTRGSAMKPWEGSWESTE
jgi:hypothetical protein